MDACLPDWNTEVEVELPVPSLRKPLGVSDELVELVWQNRELVFLSQTHRKPTFDATNDETDSWYHCPIDESFEKEFLADLSPQNPLSSPDEAKELSGKFEGVDLLNFGSSDVNNISFPRSLQPPTFETSDRNTGNLELPVKRHAFNETASDEICKCWDKAMGSSHCGSNQVANHDLDMSRGLRCGIGSRMLSAEVDKNWAWKVGPQSENTERRETLEQATTSLEGSPTSFWRTEMHSSDNYKRKRKIEDVEETECGSDATESESAARNKLSPRSGRTRTRRVAEVHNLSERRRRDRINEKLRALRELIPHCNKSGKASILDDAIRYMKSLQLQLQLMRMRSGMAQMMLPVMQHYLSRVGTNTGLPMLPVYQNLMPASRLPLVDRSLSVAPTLNQATIGQGLVLNPADYLNQMQNRGSLEQYDNYMGFCPMQNTSQERLPPRINLRSVEPRLSNRQ